MFGEYWGMFCANRFLFAETNIEDKAIIRLVSIRLRICTIPQILQKALNAQIKVCKEISTNYSS